MRYKITNNGKRISFVLTFTQCLLKNNYKKSKTKTVRFGPRYVINAVGILTARWCPPFRSLSLTESLTSSISVVNDIQLFFNKLYLTIFLTHKSQKKILEWPRVRLLKSSTKLKVWILGYGPYGPDNTYQRLTKYDSKFCKIVETMFLTRILSYENIEYFHVVLI